MNLKNLIMWAIIVLLSIGLFNMFQNPNSRVSETSSKVPFSEFLTEVDSGRVVEIEIQGNNIKGVLSDGSTFTTYSPNYPNLVERLSEKGVSIVATPVEDKMPSLLGILLSLLVGSLIVLPKFFFAIYTRSFFLKFSKGLNKLIFLSIFVIALIEESP